MGGDKEGEEILKGSEENLETKKDRKFLKETKKSWR
jgi:hypothetical protein